MLQIKSVAKLKKAIIIYVHKAVLQAFFQSFQVIQVEAIVHGYLYSSDPNRRKNCSVLVCFKSNLWPNLKRLNGQLKYNHKFMYKKYTTPCPIYGMWGSRKTSCDGLSNKKPLKGFTVIIYVRKAVLQTFIQSFQLLNRNFQFLQVLCFSQAYVQ